MNKFKKEFYKLFSDKGEIGGCFEVAGIKTIEVWNWINKNYVPKPKDKSFYGLVDELVNQKIEQILNLECLKEEKITAELEDEACKMEQESEGSVSAFEFIENEQKEMETRNNFRKQLIEEIKNEEN